MSQMFIRVFAKEQKLHRNNHATVATSSRAYTATAGEETRHGFRRHGATSFFLVT